MNRARHNMKQTPRVNAPAEAPATALIDEWASVENNTQLKQTAIIGDDSGVSSPTIGAGNTFWSPAYAFQDIATTGGILQIDLTLGQVINLTHAHDITIEFLNAPAAERTTILLHRTRDSAGIDRIIDWAGSPQSFDFTNGFEPLLTQVDGASDTISITTIDGVTFVIAPEISNLIAIN